MASEAHSAGTAEFTNVAGITTRYLRAGSGPDVLVLHGWGANIEAVQPIINGLAAAHRVLAVDLPGFGESGLPPQAWGVADYAAWTLALMDRFELTAPPIIGHSNGGRIAIHLAAHNPDRVSKLVLVDAAGIRPKRTFRYYTKVYSAKTVKHLGPRLGPLGRRMQARIAARMASSDYASAGAMRPTFVRLVNEDLTPLLSQIKAPTILIWGENDDQTPVHDGETMERLIPDSALIVFEGAGHFAYLDEPRRFTVIAANFLSAPVTVSR